MEFQNHEEDLVVATSHTKDAQSVRTGDAEGDATPLSPIVPIWRNY